ncbi:hypothetical protein [Streptomyces sp. NPDC016845]|uniref:hypothetical protein n=1 Tax=Streptomyces sp. NPDC016845 TaxID=3364972 RepID=UPI00379D0D5A
MFRRKAKDSDTAQAAEERTATVTDEPETDAAEGSASAEGAASEAEAAEGGKAEQKAGEAEDDGAAGAAAPENVEIPQQQSVEQAADSEAAGEGARK